jgi:hypothetical protein
MTPFLAVATRALALFALVLLSSCAQMPGPASGLSSVPTFQADPLWPQPLPENSAGVQQLFGQVAGIAVDPRNGHIWAVHRPRRCCRTKSIPRPTSR